MILNRAARRALAKQLRPLTFVPIRSMQRPISTCTPPRSMLRHDFSPRFRKTVPSRHAFSTYQTPLERFRNAMNKARQEYPVLLPVLFVASFAALSLLALMAYDDVTRVSPQYTDWPPNVEQALRFALHHTHVSPDPDIAAQAYTRALEEAEKYGMDPFGKEVLGIRIKLAEMLEKFGRMKGSIEVLKGIAKDCEEKVRDMDRGLIRKKRLENKEEVTDQRPNFSILRQDLLRQVIQCDVKAADLCTGEYIQDPNAAKEFLSKAMKLLVGESNDARKNGFSEDNGAGLTMQEIASILSQAGDLYSMTQDQATAVQIYMMAVDPLRKACDGKASCKEVQLLSNVAGSMAMALKDPKAKINGKPATKESLKVARRTAMAWASQATQVAHSVDPEERDGMCEIGIISATMNIAEMLMDEGSIAEAKNHWRELLPILRGKGLDSLAKTAEEGLRRAEGKK